MCKCTVAPSVCRTHRGASSAAEWDGVLHLPNKAAAKNLKFNNKIIKTLMVKEHAITCISANLGSVLYLSMQGV